MIHRARPSRHLRRVHTKKGIKRRIINPHIKKKIHRTLSSHEFNIKQKEFNDRLNQRIEKANKSINAVWSRDDQDFLEKKEEQLKQGLRYHTFMSDEILQRRNQIKALKARKEAYENDKKEIADAIKEKRELSQKWGNQLSGGFIPKTKEEPINTEYSAVASKLNEQLNRNHTKMLTEMAKLQKKEKEINNKFVRRTRKENDEIFIPQIKHTNEKVNLIKNDNDEGRDVYVNLGNAKPVKIKYIEQESPYHRIKYTPPKKLKHFEKKKEEESSVLEKDQF